MTDLTAWLGDTETTPEQYAHLQAASEMVTARYPGPDLGGERVNALNGAAQIILGDTTIGDAGHAYSQAKRRADDALEELTGAIIGIKLLHPLTTEQQIADGAGVSRDTARKALGKKRAAQR